MEDRKKEDNEVALAVALMMYANEPCRICGRQITVMDVRTAVFAGYSDIRPARAAHRDCWEGLRDVVRTMDQELLDEMRMEGVKYE